MLVINWENGVQRFHVMLLLPLVEEVLLLKSQFEIISFKHVYRERNHFADRLSKEASEQP
jgi:hypothetical protein